MAKKLYVVSTLTSDNLYQNHNTDTGNDLPAPITVDGHEGVLVKGGAGIANDRLITPQGVATEVTASQLEYLRHNKVFQLHERNGYVSALESDGVDAENVAADMERQDKSAPLTDSDFKGDETDPAPTTGRASRTKSR